jgi:hypothetical protein
MESNHDAALDVTDGLVNYLKEKCDRYEAALKEISGEPYSIGVEGATWGDSKYDSMSAAAGYNAAIDNTTRIANEALAGEDRICPNCKKVFNADRHGSCRECGSDEYNKQKEGQ